MSEKSGLIEYPPRRARHSRKITAAFLLTCAVLSLVLTWPIVDFRKSFQAGSGGDNPAFWKPCTRMEYVKGMLCASLKYVLFSTLS